MRCNLPKDIRIACPWYKPKNNKVNITPNYYIHTSEEWLVFPHEILGLTKDEILKNKHDLKNIIDLFNIN